MKPPSWVVELAIYAAKQSPCVSKRGAVIWSNGLSVSVGFNKLPDPFICDGSKECKKTCGKKAVHAEQYALINYKDHTSFSKLMLHVKVVEGELVESGSPSCLECSKLILAAGIEYMWLYHEEGWKRYTALEFHKSTLKYVFENSGS